MITWPVLLLPCLSIIHAAEQPEPIAQHCLLRSRITFEEDASGIDPLEAVPCSWLDGGIGLERVIDRMRRQPVYRQEFYANCGGLSFAEVDLVLRKVQPSWWGMFLSEECLEVLKPSAWYAFTRSYFETGHLSTITLQSVFDRELISDLHVSGLTYLLEHHLRHHGSLDPSLSTWILQASPHWQLKPEDWQEGLAWETISPQAIWCAYENQKVWPSLVAILPYFASKHTESSLREAVHRLLHLQYTERYLRRVGCDDEIFFKLLSKAAAKVEDRIIKIHQGMIAHDQARFTSIALWAAHLSQAHRKYASGPRPSLPPLSHSELLSTLLEMEGGAGRSRFARRWHWRILENGVGNGAEGAARELAAFLVTVGAGTVSVEEAESLIRTAKETGNGPVWSVLVREFRANKAVGWMLSMLSMNTKKEERVTETVSSPPLSLADCSIQ